MSNYIPYKNQLKDLDLYDLISPRENVIDYKGNPLGYINVVHEHLVAEKLKTYSLPELVKVEDQFKTAYSWLSDEQKNECKDVCSDVSGQLFDLQIKKTEGNSKSLIEQGFLSPRDNPADYLDPLDYFTVVKESIEAGKMNTYSFTELQKVEDKCKDAYAQLSEKKKGIYLDDCLDTIADLSKLYIQEDKRLDKELQIITDLSNDLKDNVDEGIENVFYAYNFDSKHNYRSWKGFALTPEITVEEQEIDAEELNEILTLEDMDNLWSQYNPQDFAGKRPQVCKVGSPKDDEKSYTLEVLRRAQERAKETAAEPFGIYFDSIASPSDKVSFKAYCATSLPKKNAPAKWYEPKVIITKPAKAETKPVYTPQIEYDVDVSEFWVDVAPRKSLENIIVAPFPKKKGNKVLSFLAQAAMVAGLGFLAVGGYNSVNQTADVSQKADYHGTAAAEVAPMTSAKASAKSSEKKMEKEVAPSKVAPKIAVVLPQKKVVKRFPPNYSSSYGNYHPIEKGDTLAGLFEDYRARGGSLSRSDYFKTIRMTNPQIENLSTIYVGQVIQEPNN